MGFVCVIFCGKNRVLKFIWNLLYEIMFRKLVANVCAVELNYLRK